MRKTGLNRSMWSVLLVFGAGGCEQAVAPAEQVRQAAFVFSTAEGPAARAATAAALAEARDKPGARLYFGGARGATLDGLLADLGSVQHEGAAAQSRQKPWPGTDSVSTAYYNPRPSGNSWMYVWQRVLDARDVYYRAYTNCIDCGSSDRPGGMMRVRQYAGSIPTLVVDRTFSSFQAFAQGEVATSLTGAPQQGMISTTHTVETWAGSKPPPVYSSASGTV